MNVAFLVRSTSYLYRFSMRRTGTEAVLYLTLQAPERLFDLHRDSMLLKNLSHLLEIVKERLLLGLVVCIEALEQAKKVTIRIFSNQPVSVLPLNSFIYILMEITVWI